MASKLFGTDGIRGMANKYPMTVEMALSVGKALAYFFSTEGRANSIIIGKDTRVSGDMISAALAAGVCAMGSDAILVECIPTPAVAYLTRSSKACAGIVVSASHNPFHDNGIKVFGPNGYKLSEEVESDLEMSLLENDWERLCCEVHEPGVIYTAEDAEAKYLSFLLKSLPEGFSLDGMRIVLDCANGATHQIAPTVFEKLGGEAKVLFAEPDGKNINEGCGSQHPETLAKEVIETGSELGLAFDGDGDRLIAVDEKGEALTGDQIIAICAKWMHEKGELKKNQVVTTVMSNLGLKTSLKEMGIEHLESGVGDRFVLEKMIATGSVLGGEDSGHILFLNHHTTGDGILAAMQLLHVMKESGRPLSELKEVMSVYPQVLINVPVIKKPGIDSMPEIQGAITDTEKDLGANGRVLVRYSGTEPICRVMVEGPTPAETEAYAIKIADTVQGCIGKK
jgi:phosphoglucosamine mutase